MIKESRYLEIKPVYLQLNAPLFALAGLNDILWLFSIGGSLLLSPLANANLSLEYTVREDTSSGRKCDVTFLLFLRKYAKIGKNNREKLVPNAKSSLPVSRRNIREL